MTHVSCVPSYTARPAAECDAFLKSAPSEAGSVSPSPSSGTGSPSPSSSGAASSPPFSSSTSPLSPSSSAAPSEVGSSPSSSSSPPIAAIAGGVAGGVVLIALAVVAFIFFRRKNSGGPDKHPPTSDIVSSNPQNIQSMSGAPPAGKDHLNSNGFVPPPAMATPALPAMPANQQSQLEPVTRLPTVQDSLNPYGLMPSPQAVPAAYSGAAPAALTATGSYGVPASATYTSASAMASHHTQQIMQPQPSSPVADDVMAPAYSAPAYTIEPPVPPPPSNISDPAAEAASSYHTRVEKTSQIFANAPTPSWANSSSLPAPNRRSAVEAVNVAGLGVDTLGERLTAMGVAMDLVSALKSHEVSGKMLLEMEARELEQIGITDVYKQKVLVNAVAMLKAGSGAPPAPPGSV
ncbi:hypothetical protein HDU96_009436 [Phlyctochytrium bullatum]|nr:hypothetical protein HDU96_009436 [Phlyctochytrium bullatum]